jgi:hypothetical protein
MIARRKGGVGDTVQLLQEITTNTIVYLLEHTLCASRYWNAREAALNREGTWLVACIVTMMFESVDSASLFWARLMELCSPGPPDLLCLICAHLSDAQQQALRGVNEAMRLAMNSTVKHISVRRPTLPATHQRLLTTFPNLTALILGPVEPRSRYLADCRVCLKRLVSHNKALLSNLHRLTLAIPFAIAAEAEATAIWNVLDR